MSVFVKAHPIKHLTDARFFASQPSVKLLGFDINQTSELNHYKDIAQWIEGISITAFVKDLLIENMAQVYSELHLTALELSSGEYRKYKNELEIPTIVRIHYSPVIRFHYYTQSETPPLYAVLEIDNWKDVSTTHLASLCAEFPTILSTTWDIESLSEALQLVKPHGIEISGSDESSIGIKDFDTIQNLLDTLDSCNN